MEMLYFFLPGIILLGLATSYEDIRGRGIRNKWVLLGLAYAFIVLSVLVGYIAFSGLELFPGYLGDYFLNIVIALAFGYVIWYAGFWSAGDAKLFLAFSALVPLSVYSVGYVRFFPSFTLFINMLFPVFVFLVGGLLFRTSLREKARAVRKSLNPSLFLRAVMSLFGLSWLVRILFSFLGIEYDLFSFLILVPVVYVVISGLAGKRMEWMFIALFALRVVLDYSYILSMDFAYRFLYIIIFYVFIRYFIFGLSHEFFSRPLDIEDIREGMMLADSIHKDGEKYEVRSSFMDFSGGRGGGQVFNKRSLARGDIEKLRGLHKEGRIGPELRVQKTMPFAIFVFLGVLLTLAFQGNIIIAIKSFLGF